MENRYPPVERIALNRAFRDCGGRGMLQPRAYTMDMAFTFLPRHRLFHAGIVLAAALVLPAPAQEPAPEALVPPAFLLDESAVAAINAQWLSDDERHALRVRHGVWDERDLTTPALWAMVALNAGDFT